MLMQRLRDSLATEAACRFCNAVAFAIWIALGLTLVLIGAGICQVADVYNDHHLLHSGLAVAVIGGVILGRQACNVGQNG